MITPDYKPTGWEETPRAYRRRAAVWPTIVLWASKVPGNDGGFLWTADLGAPGISVEYESGYAATPEEGRAIAESHALRWINEARARIDEALAACRVATGTTATPAASNESR